MYYLRTNEKERMLGRKTFKVLLGGFLFFLFSLYMFFSYEFPHSFLFNFSRSKFKYVISNVLCFVPSQRLI